MSTRTSHTRAVWSKLTVTTRVPSGLNAALTTLALATYLGRRFATHPSAPFDGRPHRLLPAVEPSKDRARYVPHDGRSNAPPPGSMSRRRITGSSSPARPRSTTRWRSRCAARSRCRGLRNLEGALELMRGDSYERVTRSRWLPGLDLDLTCTFFDRRSVHIAKRDFREALRNTA